MALTRFQAVATAVSLVFGLAGAATHVTTSAPPAAPAHAAVADPDGALGAGWRTSADALVTGVGDTDGFHLYVARENQAFQWSTLATLHATSLDVGPWTGYTCVTGSGRYAVAVYAPAMASNKPALEEAGALAAVVDIDTGRSTVVASGVQLAYFNPACGPTDDVLLTRALGDNEQQTDLLTVDAATAQVVATTRVDAQLTTPLATSGGDYGIAHGNLVRVGASGALTTLATPAGRPFALAASSGNAIDLVSVHGQQVIAERYAAGRMNRIGTAAPDRLQLFGLRGGTDLLVGDTSNLHSANYPGLSVTAADQQVDGVSEQGHLLLRSATTKQADETANGGLARADPKAAGTMSIVVQATYSGHQQAGTVTATKAPVLNSLVAGTGTALQRPMDPPPPIIDVPACAVPRNETDRQVPQPSPNQVEWAIDQAVHGDLTVARPTDYLHTGEPGYTPDGMFGFPTDVTVPAQVMLGIVAQETNMSQASWHAVPGDAGNPLVANYYGGGSADIDEINYRASDCGYGISQVTSGMQTEDTTTFTPAQQVAIATDYAANIAAGLHILVQKWRQLQSDNTYLNDDDPHYIENWYLAIWGYNSGVYANNGGPYGVGWLNNPANPAYPAGRHRFLAKDSDASHPSDWPYQERVMGWIEKPQQKGDPAVAAYSTPNFGSAAGGQLSLPDHYLFCDGVANQCNPSNTTNPCPNDDDTCWWHGTIGWLACTTQCATEKLNYGLGSGEPAVQRIYPTWCTPYHGPAGTVVVDDLDDSSINVEGCPAQPRGGKFSLRVGDWPGSIASYYGQVDLHQLGAGYLGHIWFTHSYDGTGEYDGNGNHTCDPLAVTPAEVCLHLVVGTWSPRLSSTGRYDVLVHLPDHGGTATVNYIVFDNSADAGTDDVHTCGITQDTNGRSEWIYLGNYPLGKAARVEMNNVETGADGTPDVAYDAVAFVPDATSSPSHGCGNTDPNN